jgi:type IV pilus assembly protein PilA
VAGISTDANGAVTATVQSISNSVNGSVVTLTPLADSTNAPAVFTVGNSGTLYGWKCGLQPGTTVPLKYLPGSCRG